MNELDFLDPNRARTSKQVTLDHQAELLNVLAWLSAKSSRHDGASKDSSDSTQVYLQHHAATASVIGRFCRLIPALQAPGIVVWKG